MKKNFLAVLALVAAASVAAPPARAQSVDALSRLRDTLKREPRASDVVKMALQHFQVHPDAIASLRSNAHWRAAMPVLSGFVNYGTANTAGAGQQSLTDPNKTQTATAGNQTTFTGGLSWDFRDAVFNPSEIQAYSLVPMSQDIILETTRNYFLRRQLQIRLAIRPPTDPVALATLELRIEEYTANLNALTGNGFQPPPSN